MAMLGQNALNIRSGVIPLDFATVKIYKLSVVCFLVMGANLQIYLIESCARYHRIGVAQIFDEFQKYNIQLVIF